MLLIIAGGSGLDDISTEYLTSLQLGLQCSHSLFWVE
jgi:hypothetical protein